MTDTHGNPIAVGSVVAVHYRVKALDEHVGDGFAGLVALDADGNEVGSRWWKPARVIRPVAAEARGVGRPNDGIGGDL